jgi:3-oxoacyl-[acyl-carrier-protein] synthase-1
MTRAFIGATGALCAIGGTPKQIWASARAGIARIGNSHVMDRNFDPIQMGLVPEDQLPPLPSEIENGLPPRARRLLRLAAPALSEITQHLKSPAKLFLGLPEFGPEQPAWLNDFLKLLAQAANAKLDLENSVIFPRGRASALLAMEAGLQALAESNDKTSRVIVGGVDSFLDFRLLADLDNEHRILGPRVMDGFIAGEGAAFLTLHAATAPPAQPLATLQGVASIDDAGNRYGSAPSKGEGLANAIDKLRSGLQSSAPIVVTYAGFNGENFDAKLWGVARMRHNDFFAPDMSMDHPADKYGDAGAATGALLTVLAAQALSRKQHTGPALIWAASDTASRACALLSPA